MRKARCLFGFLILFGVIIFNWDIVIYKFHELMCDAFALVNGAFGVAGVKVDAFIGVTADKNNRLVGIRLYVYAVVGEVI